MTPTQRLILWIYAAIVAVWPIRHLAITWIFSRLDVLTPRSPAMRSPDAPLVTAIIPAKDEEAALADASPRSSPRIIRTWKSSSSTTAAPTARPRSPAELAEPTPASAWSRSTDLPDGWTGKTHALHVASAEARGDWFWFLDADTRHAPENLSIVMEYARSHGAALASLLPEMRCETFWENVVQPLAGIVLMQSFPLFAVNDDRKPLAFANGQYILIRKDAYDAAGGHAAVRDRFVEDIDLAERVKALGLPIRVAVSTEIGSTRMYSLAAARPRLEPHPLRRPRPQARGGWSARSLEPLIFSQTGHVALIVGAGDAPARSGRAVRLVAAGSERRPSRPEDDASSTACTSSRRPARRDTPRGSRWPTW